MLSSPETPQNPPRLVLLAAGLSSRLGFPKALAPLPGGTPLQRLLQAARPIVAKAPLVVGGAHHGAIQSAMPSWAVALENLNWAAGRTGSLQQAIREAPGEALLIAPVDCARVPSLVFQTLVEAWDQAGSPPNGWLAPFVVGLEEKDRRFGHPILIGPELAQSALKLPPDAPLSRLRVASNPLLACEVTRVEILEDLDTPLDFERLCQLDRDGL